MEDGSGNQIFAANKERGIKKKNFREDGVRKVIERVSFHHDGGRRN